jgi:hypothetical protein
MSPAIPVNLHWEERQRAFQARVLTSEQGETAPLSLRPYRTFHGDPVGQPPPADSRLERAVLVIVAGIAITSALALIGAPRSLVALTAGLAGGIAVFAGLAGPDPRPQNPPETPLIAIYSTVVARGDLPDCVTSITSDEVQRLGNEGFATVIGNPRPGGTIGVFIDDYLVWARSPPRGNRRDDPGFGSL